MIKLTDYITDAIIIMEIFNKESVSDGLFLHCGENIKELNRKEDGYDR